MVAQRLRRPCLFRRRRRPRRRLVGPHGSPPGRAARSSASSVRLPVWHHRPGRHVARLPRLLRQQVRGANLDLEGVPRQVRRAPRRGGPSRLPPHHRFAIRFPPDHSPEPALGHAPVVTRRQRGHPSRRFAAPGSRTPRSNNIDRDGCACACLSFNKAPRALPVGGLPWESATARQPSVPHLASSRPGCEGRPGAARPGGRRRRLGPEHRLASGPQARLRGRAGGSPVLCRRKNSRLSCFD